MKVEDVLGIAADKVLRAKVHARIIGRERGRRIRTSEQSQAKVHHGKDAREAQAWMRRFDPDWSLV